MNCRYHEKMLISLARANLSPGLADWVAAYVKDGATISDVTAQLTRALAQIGRVTDHYKELDAAAARNVEVRA